MQDTKGFSGGLNYGPMTPIDASLSDGCIGGNFGTFPGILGNSPGNHKFKLVIASLVNSSISTGDFDEDKKYYPCPNTL